MRILGVIYTTFHHNLLVFTSGSPKISFLHLIDFLRSLFTSNFVLRVTQNSHLVVTNCTNTPIRFSLLKSISEFTKFYRTKTPSRSSHYTPTFHQLFLTTSKIIPDENLLPQRNKENFFGLSKLGLARNQSIEETRVKETRQMLKTQTSFIGKKITVSEVGQTTFDYSSAETDCCVKA